MALHRPDPKSYPHAFRWLKEHPEQAQNLYRILALMNSRYRGSYGRYIDRKNGQVVDYLYKPAEDDGVVWSIKIETRVKHSRVRFYLFPKNSLSRDWKKKVRILKSASGTDLQAIDILISCATSLEELKEFINLLPTFQADDKKNSPYDVLASGRKRGGEKVLSPLHPFPEEKSSEHFIAYHNVQRMEREFKAGEALRFWSKKKGVLTKAIGNTVWVIQGQKGVKRTTFSLCGAYRAEEVIPSQKSDGNYVVTGVRLREFDPPLPLNDLSWFSALFNSQRNFSLGFNRIADETVVSALNDILAQGQNQSAIPYIPDIDLTLSAAEGKARLVSHLRRERNRTLVEEKKTATLAATGKLCCEACGFDFSAIYGSLGVGYCEVHHVIPLASSGEKVNKLADLAILCSNCHRMIHLAEPLLSVDALSKIVQGIPAAKPAVD